MSKNHIEIPNGRQYSQLEKLLELYCYKYDIDISNIKADYEKFNKNNYALKYTKAGQIYLSLTDDHQLNFLSKYIEVLFRFI